MDSVQPARLSFLAIYNPLLGQSDETLHDQVVYYYPSKSSRGRKDPRIDSENVQQSEHEERNERLRQIGLAQGMVELAKAFSDNEPVDSIDAEKSRILLHEVEPGWWILASVHLTRIQIAPKSRSHPPDETKVEYSSREVATHGLLLQQLLRAHSIFLMHHGTSISEIYDRLTRQNFCAVLERFWNRFVRDWDVLLHGSPAVDIFNGVKIATGGELGIGVGEEEWGSGEREVLEGLISRTEGLVDIVVSRFGEVGEHIIDAQKANHMPPWLGNGRQHRSIDGVVFSGTGKLSRKSVRNLSAWMEWVYKSGQFAYGIMDSPHSARRKRRRRQNDSIDTTISSPLSKVAIANEVVSAQTTAELAAKTPTGIPPPIVRAIDSSLHAATIQAAKSEAKAAEQKEQTDHPSGTDTFVKYVTLGIYGSEWGIPAGRPRSHSHAAEGVDGSGTPIISSLEEKLGTKLNHEDSSESTLDVGKGCFLVGLQGDLDKEGIANEEGKAETGVEEAEGSNCNQRIMLRTLYLERNGLPANQDDHTEVEDIMPPEPTYADRLRVVVYVRRPFIFTFLFENHSQTLSYAALYHSLHHQLGPLQRPLLNSTSPSTAASRHAASLASPRTTSAPQSSAFSPLSTKTSTNSNPILDLVFDPDVLSVYSSIPGIPDLEEQLIGEKNEESGLAASDGRWSGDASMWTRADALNVHSQILGTWEATRWRKRERERTAKTSRGWWIVWMRLPRTTDIDSGNESEGGGFGSARGDSPISREAFLVRKASDYVPSKASSGSIGRGYTFGLGGGGSGKESAWGGAGKLAEGIGIDARRYVEGLFSLNR